MRESWYDVPSGRTILLNILSCANLIYSEPSFRASVNVLFFYITTERDYSTNLAVVCVIYLFATFRNDGEFPGRCSSTSTDLSNVAEEPVSAERLDVSCPAQCNGSDYEGIVGQGITRH